MLGHTARAGRMAKRIATLAALVVFGLGVATTVKAETRVIKLYNVHNKEQGSFAYKRNGRYVAAEMKKINWFLRDWRRNEPTTIDPRLIDLVWEAYRQTGSSNAINVVSSYRSPATNNMLRSRSSGVAKTSQHTAGKAMDFYIPGVPLKKMRDIGLKMQVGGVGYYPRSGSPFVHFDVGNARHWPRMSRKELVAVFPKGNTVHVPSDGKPLPGYQQALASYKQRKGASEVQVANASSSGGGKTLLAMLFGGGSDEAEDEADVAPAAAPAARQPAARQPEPAVAVASVVPQSRPNQSLPNAVAVQVGDRFDVTSPARENAPAVETEVAALESAKIPVPTWAPSRAMPEQPATAEPDAVSSLVAALETQAAETVAAGQMAYAVPTPRDRPQFDAVLNEPAVVAAAPAAPSTPAADPAKPTVVAAAPVPAASPRPAAKPETTQVASLLTAAASRPAPLLQPARAPVIEGKGGRVLKEPAMPPVKAVTVDPQEAIASRIAVAALVADPAQRARELPQQMPDGHRLVGDVPSSVFAAGFAPATAAQKTGRFSGSAVNFLPLVKLQ
ncbi:DUF882 domain-containing protein [Aurantimonas endophytica]|uniref:Murein endopeptidase K n=1 Tax=Aurantimonas endophytica TaxID=1522175 RepID=A0A7W6MQH2_9HYPH|nr:DUF882 domain-containing protein [Aurantimonas endophytica]MBB4003947.1 uncharacterized protein YcbK (DUF882 family) [Aurantimonas endophytica]MCO6404797.1 DUF882 domain-containing protein [Aurantimonas endophytica]